MNNEFGDIELFNSAIAVDRLDPPVDDYLRTVGLTESEAAEVRVLYRAFCQAIENASTADLPDLVGGSQSESRASTTSARTGAN